jgi:hypothetical protein
MSDQDPSVTAIVTAIECAASGRWAAWLSDTGWWWAARTEPLTAREISAGCLPHIHADNPDELTERIREQDRLRAGPASGSDTHHSDPQPHPSQQNPDRAVTMKTNPSAGQPPIIEEREAARRMLILTELQAALTATGIRSILARNHRLILRYNQTPCAPSGLTDPQLHIFSPEGTDIATTDGTSFSLASGPQYPAASPIAAATNIRHGHHIASPP